jgi:glycosyltransferase involved in cell wall biosynthesis
VEVLAAGLGGRGHTVDVVGCDIHPHAGVLTHPWGRSISLSPAFGLKGRVGKAGEWVVRWLTKLRFPAIWRAIPYTLARRELGAALALRKYVRRAGVRYDVIEYPNWPGEAAFLPLPSPAPYVVRLSTPAEVIQPEAVLPAMERRAIRQAELIISNSAAMAKKGEQLYEVPAVENITIIPHGLPDRPPAVAPPDDGRLYLMFLGRAEKRKGTDHLITALARVLPEFPNVVFRFVGSGLPQYLRDQSDIRVHWEQLQSHCPGRAIDAGLVTEEERDRLLASSHWLITPSRFESFGLVAVEAMRAGTPVVYAESGGLTEVGLAGPHNLPVRADDTVDLERGLREICRLGPGAAIGFRPATRNTFLQLFDQNSMVSRTLDVYQTLLNRPHAVQALP